MKKSFKQYLQSQGKSKSTVSHYNSYILDFIGFLDSDNTEVENATAKEVMSYLNRLQHRGLENKTRSIRLNVIKQFFNWQIEQGHRTENPVMHLKIRGSKTRKLYPILNHQALENLFEMYPVPENDDKNSTKNWFKAYQLSKQRNKAILSLLVNQALTTPEIERLETNHLQLKAGKIYIAGSRRSNEREMELKSHQILELMEYEHSIREELLKYQNRESKRLFLPVPSAGKQYASESLQIWKGLTRELKTLQPGFVNLKQIRTSVITHWLQQYNLRQVQYMAGHRYISSTESYMVNHTEDLQQDIDRFHPF